MALTSLSAISSILVAGPTAKSRKSTLAPIRPGEHLPIDLAPKPKELLPLSKEQIKDNIAIDMANGVLIKLTSKTLFTATTYKFDPELYEKIEGGKLTLAQLKQRYGLPDRVIAENNSLGHAHDLDSSNVKSPVAIPPNYIDKYVDKK